MGTYYYACALRNPTGHHVIGYGKTMAEADDQARREYRAGVAGGRVPPGCVRANGYGPRTADAYRMALDNLRDGRCYYCLPDEPVSPWSDEGGRSAIRAKHDADCDSRES